MTDYLQKVSDKKAEQSELIHRWKIDSDLLYLNKYIMKDKKGLHEVPDIINVTLNIPGRFANDVIATLGTAKEQSIVESDDRNLDTTNVEDFRKAGFASANARLRLQGRFELNQWFDFHSCIRGGCAARCLFRMVDGVLVPDVTPWDTGYVRYAAGAQGLGWAAYETTRQKDVIEAEYADELRTYHVNISGKSAEVLDVWTPEHNEVWVAKKKLLEQEHTFGFTPVVIQKVVLGSMLADKDSLEHQGESIFFLIRGVIPELNRLLSIMQTLNFTTLKPPAGWASRGGDKPAPEYDEAMRPASMTPHEIGGGVTEIKFGDAQRSAQLAYGIMREAIREATAAASDLGVIESPPASGVRAMVAGESRDQLLSPRLGVKALMNQGLADMFTAQVIQIGGSVELGTLGHKRSFQTSKLDGEYEGYYKYTIKSAAVDAGRASLYAAYGDAIPRRAKAVEILQREDPDGDERQLRYEEIERLVPPIKIHRDIRALLEMAEKGDKYAELEAEIASSYMGMALKQILAGELSPPKPESGQEPKQVLSLYGGDVGGRSERAPVEEEGE